jgi:2-dehydro-3-deoxyphosphooctonate aldolase (KDO 8-P synthase)
MEVHPDPDQALSDGPNMVPLHQLKTLLERVLRVWNAANREN